MKPNELINVRKNTGWRGDYLSIENTGENLDAAKRHRTLLIKDYLNTDCVIAYIKETLGTIILIKGTKKYFGYVITNDSYHYATCFRVSTKRIFSLLHENPNLKIVDNDIYEIFMKTEVVNNL